MGIIEERIRIVDEASATLRKVGREARNARVEIDGLTGRFGKLKVRTAALREDIAKMNDAQEASTKATSDYSVAAAAAGVAIYYLGRRVIQMATDLEKLQRATIAEQKALTGLGPGLAALERAFNGADLAGHAMGVTVAENTAGFTRLRLGFETGAKVVGIAAVKAFLDFNKAGTAVQETIDEITSAIKREGIATRQLGDDVAYWARVYQEGLRASLAGLKRIEEARAKAAANRLGTAPGTLPGYEIPNMGAHPTSGVGLSRYFAPGTASGTNQAAAAGGPPGGGHMLANMTEAAQRAAAAQEDAAERTKQAWMATFDTIGRAVDVFGATFIKNTKARALLSIAVDTAAGIMKAIATGGDNIAAGLAMGVAVAGIGAMQAAAVLKATKGGAPQGLSYGGGGGLNALTGRGGGGGAGALVVSGAGGGGGFNLWDAISGLFSEEEQTYDYGGGANSGRGGSYRRGGGTIHIRAADRDGALRELVRDLNRILGPRGLGVQLSGV